jgi:hypothetical protein
MVTRTKGVVASPLEDVNGYINIMDEPYEAVPNDASAAITNNAAIQQACTDARDTGQGVFIPAGQWHIDVDDASGGSIDIPGIHFIGVKTYDVSNGASDPTVDRGSVFHITGGTIAGDNNVAFKVYQGSTIEGISVFYPDQPADSTLIPYPETWKAEVDTLQTVIGQNNGSAAQIRFYDLHTVNSYFFINIADTPPEDGAVGKCMIRNCAGYAINQAIRINAHNDIIHIVDCQFNPGFWGLAVADTVAVDHTRNNGVAFDLAGGNDGLSLISCQCNGYNKGVRMYGDDNSARVVLSACAFEARQGIDIQGAGPATVMFIDSCKFQASSNSTIGTGKNTTNDISIIIGGTPDANNWRQNITITGCQFRSANNQHIKINSGNKTAVSITGCNFWNPVFEDLSQVQSASILIDAAESRVNICDNYFANSSHPTLPDAIRVIDTEDLIVTGNIIRNYRSAVRIPNASSATNLIVKNNIADVSDTAPVINVAAATEAQITSDNIWDGVVST